MATILFIAALLSATAEQPRDSVIERNLAVPTLAAVDSLLALEQPLPTAQRIGLWARRFHADGSFDYCFGLADGGYVDDGLLVPGKRQDCVSFLYRTTELARATDARDAVLVALDTRFAGADLDSIIQSDGRVDYERPEHLDFSLDMIRSGHWGRDVTASLTGMMMDETGSVRYPAGSFSQVPAGALVADELREGDLAWLVLSPDEERAARLRTEYGLVIGHVGIIVVDHGIPMLIHAASKPLPGWYDQGGIVKVPLAEYLHRVERYDGVLITRFDP